MTCREARHLLFSSDSRASAAPAEAGAGGPSPAALDAHLAACPHCRQVSQVLRATITDWRTDASAVAVPAAEREWLELRRRIHRGAAEERRPLARRLLPWVALPLAAAAALAVLLVDRSGPALSSAGPTPAVARADSVEVPGGASPLVYVDDKSGWLIVWASDAREI